MKKITIKLDEKEFETLEKRVKEKDDFESVEDYVQDIVAQVVERLETEENDDNDDEEFSKEDEEKVKERLRSLGYLD